MEVGNSTWRVTTSRDTFSRFEIALLPVPIELLMNHNYSAHLQVSTELLRALNAGLICLGIPIRGGRPFRFHICRSDCKSILQRQDNDK